MAAPRTRGHGNRYRRIANILARHGLGYFAGMLGLGRFIPFHRGLLGHPRRAEPYTQPEHVRMAIEELGIAKGHVDRAAPRADLEHLVSRYYGKPLGEISLGPIHAEAMSVVRRHRLRLPSSLALLLKTLLMSAGLGAQLDPSFNMTVVLAPYARQLMLRQYSPFVWAERLGRTGLDAARLGAERPQQVRRILGDLERSGLDVRVRPESLDTLSRRVERLLNRVALAILAAALINGFSVLMTVYHPPGWERWMDLLFFLGLILAGGLGGYLVWSILHSGRH